MRSAKDSFTNATKEKIAREVGYICSNPSCMNYTLADNTIGEAAHIKGAAPGSARYDPKMTPEERKNSNNGIWLCPSCHTLIDKPNNTVGIEDLYSWKFQAQKSARLRLGTSSMTVSPSLDLTLEYKDPFILVKKVYQRISQSKIDDALTEVHKIYPKEYWESCNIDYQDWKNSFNKYIMNIHDIHLLNTSSKNFAIILNNTGKIFVDLCHVNIFLSKDNNGLYIIAEDYDIDNDEEICLSYPKIPVLPKEGFSNYELFPRANYELLTHTNFFKINIDKRLKDPFYWNIKTYNNYSSRNQEIYSKKFTNAEPKKFAFNIGCNSSVVPGIHNVSVNVIADGILPITRTLKVEVREKQGNIDDILRDFIRDLVS